MADTIPIKALYNQGVPYALGEFSSGDTISPYYTAYNSGTNSIITADNVQDALAQVESKLEFFNSPTGDFPYFEAYGDTQYTKEWAVWFTIMRNNVILHDTANAYNIVDYSYNIPYKGIWKFSAIGSVSYYSGGWHQGRGLDFFVNGTLKKQFHSQDFDDTNSYIDVDNESNCGNMTVELNVGDKVQAVWKNPATGTNTMRAGYWKHGFSGYLHRITE